MTRSVTSRPTLCISLPPSARTVTSRQAIQRAPSGAAIFWSCTRVPSGKAAAVALLFHRQREGGAEQFLARASGQRAERIIGISDRAVAVAAHDDVALRLEKAFGALLRFADFPVAVFGLVEPPLEAAQLRLHLADAGQQDAHAAARRAEQRRDADGKRIRIVMGAVAKSPPTGSRRRPQTTSR